MNKSTGVRNETGQLVYVVKLVNLSSNWSTCECFIEAHSNQSSD